MQLTYEYTVKLIFVNKGKSKIIPQNNIRSIIINKNFDSLTMPTITMSLEMDRELADEIIKNKKTASMFLRMNKIQTMGATNAIEEKYFDDIFTYLIEEDLDKTKKFRYNDPDIKNQKATEADKYRPIRIGLISKTSSDAARKPNNFVAYKSSMQDIVIKLLNINKPLLIEPFDYKESISQFIVPPKETITKVLEYLNKIKVFYSTGYRFFMDLDAMYLVSKSGKYIAKQNEKAGIVNIEVKTLDKHDSLIRGMSFENSAYSVIVEASNSNLDNTDLTDKEINSITAVVDGSKEKQKSFLKQNKGFGGILGTYTNIMNTIDNISKLTAQVRTTVGNIHAATYEIKAKLTELTDAAASFETTTQALITTTQATLAQIPKEAEKEFSKKYPDLLKNILHHASNVSSNYNKNIIPAPQNMNNFTDQYLNQIYNIEATKGLVGGIEPNLLSDNVSPLMKLTNNFEKDKENSKQAFDGSLVKLSTDYSKYTHSIGQIRKSLSAAPKKFTYEIREGKGKEAKVITKTIDFAPLKKFLDPVAKEHSASVGRMVEINSDKKTMKDSLTINKNIGSAVKNSVDSIKNIPKNFKTKMLEGENSYVSNLKNLKESSISDYKNTVSTLSNDFKSITDSFNAIKNSASLSIDSLKDISNIGSNGESIVNIALDAAEIVGDLNKRKIIRLPNDNINILKNIKHSLELRRVKIKVHKQELDNSIFTINKKFVINFEGTDNVKYKGDYLLESMIEVYTNSGTQLQSNTILNFAKLPKK